MSALTRASKDSKLPSLQATTTSAPPTTRCLDHDYHGLLPTRDHHDHNDDHHHDDHNHDDRRAGGSRGTPSIRAAVTGQGGHWGRVPHRIGGRHRESSGLRISMSRNGPDLRVILSPSDLVDDRDAYHVDGFYDLGVLKGNQGNQNYEIPDEVDLSQYSTVAIFCIRFNYTFNAATIS